jgi:hypothetical protein
MLLVGQKQEGCFLDLVVRLVLPPDPLQRLDVVGEKALRDEFGRVADDDGGCRDVQGEDGSRANQGPVSDPNPGQDVRLNTAVMFRSRSADLALWTSHSVPPLGAIMPVPSSRALEWDLIASALPRLGQYSSATGARRTVDLETEALLGYIVQLDSRLG